MENFIPILSLSIGIGILATAIFMVFNLQTLTMVGLLAFLIKLSYTNELALLIHPRFFWLIYLTIAVLVLVIIFAKRDKSHLSILKSIAFTVLNFFIFMGLIIDFQPLSSFAQQQSVSTEFFTAESALRQKKMTSFNLNTAELSLEEWVTIFSANPEPSNYEGKEAHLTGFYHLDATGHAMIARYVVSCCAADGRIIGIWMAEDIDVPVNTWLEAKGKLTEVNVDGQRSIGFKTDSYNIIEAPKDPYVTK